MNAFVGPFVAVVPIKPPAVGKSRLVGLPDDQRSALARAFALDTIEACLAAEAVAGVVAMTDDYRLALDLAAECPDCVVVPDGVSGDLNGSLVQAAHEAVRRWPGHGVAAICADLPALRSSELTAALATVDVLGFVPDAAGTGTTVYAARSLADFAPAFGPGSAAAHAAQGAQELLDWPSVRQDVDEVGDLGRALLLGVGRHTAAISGR
jgi:2-phospho-L-lactate guanylyltransferase